MEKLSEELAERIKEVLDEEVPYWSPKKFDIGCEASKVISYEINFGDIYMDVECRIDYASVKHDGDYYCPPDLEQEWRYEVLKVEVWVDNKYESAIYKYPGIKGEIKR